MKRPYNILFIAHLDRCTRIHMVEAGGIEPTVRKTDHRRISERRL